MHKITQFLKKNLFIVVVISVLIALSTVFIIWNKNYLFVPTKTVAPTQIPLASPPIQTQSQVPSTPVPEIQKTEGFLGKALEALSSVLRGGLEKSDEQPTPTPGVGSQGSPESSVVTPSGSEQGAGSVPLGTKPSQGSSSQGSSDTTASEGTEPKSAFSPKPVRIP